MLKRSFVVEVAGLSVKAQIPGNFGNRTIRFTIDTKYPLEPPHSISVIEVDRMARRINWNAISWNLPHFGNLEAVKEAIITMKSPPLSTRYLNVDPAVYTLSRPDTWNEWRISEQSSQAVELVQGLFAQPDLDQEEDGVELDHTVFRKHKMPGFHRPNAWNRVWLRQLTDITPVIPCNDTNGINTVRPHYKCHCNSCNGQEYLGVDKWKKHNPGQSILGIETREKSQDGRCLYVCYCSVCRGTDVKREVWEKHTAISVDAAAHWKWVLEEMEPSDLVIDETGA